MNEWKLISDLTNLMEDAEILINEHYTPINGNSLRTKYDRDADEWKERMQALRKVLFLEFVEIDGITYKVTPTQCPRCSGTGLEKESSVNCYECAGNKNVLNLELMEEAK